MKSNMQRTRRRALALVIPMGAMVFVLPVCGAEDAPAKITYDEHIQPILREKCFSCHNTDKRSGDLDMTNYTNLMQGGGSGQVIEPGDSSSSYLYQLVTHQEEPYMPPESPKLADAILNTVRDWIDGGALENAGSKAPVIKKPSFDFALTAAPTERPDTPSMPARLSLQPIRKTSMTTAVSAVATNPWSPLVAIAGPGQVVLYHTQTMEIQGILPYPEGVPHVLKFSRNGSLLLAGGGRGGASGLAIVWSVRSGERIFEVGDELDAVLAADISADHTQIALGGPQRIVRVYSTETGKLLREIRKHTDWIYAMAFSPDDVLLATSDRNGGLFIWEGYTGREYLTLKGHGGAVTGVSWRADSNVLASCSEDGTVRLWEMENGNQVKNWGAHGGGVASIEFSRDGRILTGGRDRMVKLWAQDGNQLKAFEEFTDLALRVTICDESNRAIAGDWNGNIRVWNAENGDRLGELTANPPTLVERVETATQILTANQSIQQEKAVADEAAQKAAGDSRSTLAAAETAMADAQQRSDSAATTVRETQDALGQQTTQSEQLNKTVAGLTTALPVLLEAAQKVRDAAEKLPNDEELAKGADQLASLAEQRASRLDQTKKTVSEVEATIEQTKQKLAEANQQAADMSAELKTAQEKVDMLSPLAKEADEKANTAASEADAASNEVAVAQKEFDRWTEEIAFTNQLNELAGVRRTALDVLVTRKNELEALLEAAKTAQTAADQAAAKANEAQQEVERIGQQINEIRGLE